MSSFILPGSSPCSLHPLPFLLRSQPYSSHQTYLNMSPNSSPMVGPSLLTEFELVNLRGALQMSSAFPYDPRVEGMVSMQVNSDVVCFRYSSHLCSLFTDGQLRLFLLQVLPLSSPPSLKKVGCLVVMFAFPRRRVPCLTGLNTFVWN